MDGYKYYKLILDYVMWIDQSNNEIDESICMISDLVFRNYGGIKDVSH